MFPGLRVQRVMKEECYRIFMTSAFADIFSWKGEARTVVNILSIYLLGIYFLYSGQQISSTETCENKLSRH